MNEFIEWTKSKLKVGKRLIILYCIVYLLWGCAMNWIGTELQIARFVNGWQVITCYVIYMVPLSLMLRNLPWHTQYAYGLIAMGVLEFFGYALGTSYAYPNNSLDQFFNIRNFSLGMALFFAFYFPLGNWGVGKLYSLIFPAGSA